MDQVKQGIQYAFQTQNGWTFAISGTGESPGETVSKNLCQQTQKMFCGWHTALEA